MHYSNLRRNLLTSFLLLTVTATKAFSVGNSCVHCNRDDSLCLSKCIILKDLIQIIKTQNNAKSHINLENTSDQKQSTDSVQKSDMGILNAKTNVMTHLQEPRTKRSQPKYFYTHIRFGKRLSPEEIPEDSTFYPQGRFGKRADQTGEVAYDDQGGTVSSNSPVSDGILHRAERFQPQGRFGKRDLFELYNEGTKEKREVSDRTNGDLFTRKRRFQPQGRFGKRSDLLSELVRSKEPYNVNIGQYLVPDKEQISEDKFNRQARFQPQGRFGKRLSNGDDQSVAERRFYPQNRFGKRSGEDDPTEHNSISRQIRFQPQGRFGKRSSNLSPRYTVSSGDRVRTSIWSPTSLLR